MDVDNSAPPDSCVPVKQTELVVIYVIQGIYGVLSVLLYIFNINALLHHRSPLDKIFSKLYIACAITSIIYFVAHYTIQRFVGLGFWCDKLLDALGEPTWALNPYKSISTYCPMALLVLHFMISLNRLTLVLAPFSAAEIWSSHFGKILILSLLVPLIFTWFVLPCRSFAQLDKPDGGLEIEYEKIFTLSASLHSAIAATLFGLLTFFATIVIIIKLLCSNLKRLSSAEKTMFAFEVFLALTTLMYATTQALLYSSKYLFKDPEMQRAVRISRNFIIDIFILPNAWTLPLLSHSVRRYHAKSILRLVGKSTNIARSSNVTQRLPLRRVK